MKEEAMFGMTKSRLPRRQSAPPRGQIIIMFAVALTALIGMLALAVDLGYGFSQRRNTQNAADAGAMAGALSVLKNTNAESNITAAISGNQFGDTGAGATLTSCDYVPYTMKDDSAGSPWTSLGGCNQNPPSGATGVHIHVSENHPTFFMRALGINTTTTTGVATAHVQPLLDPPGNAPFIVCGIRTETMSNQGPKPWVLKHDANAPYGYSFNKQADGILYKIHGPQVADCDTRSGDFKGFADMEANTGNGLNEYWNYEQGDEAGVINNINGVNGCKTGVPIPAAGCVMFLPVAIDQPRERQPSYQEIWVVAYGAFHVTCESNNANSNCNTHSGRFIYDYSVLGPGDPDTPWDPTVGGPIVLRLTQ